LAQLSLARTCRQHLGVLVTLALDDGHQNRDEVLQYRCVHHHLADGREKFLIFHARPPGVVSLCGDILRDLLEMAPQRARCMPDRAAN
jgi:hypothetical protein